MDEGNSNAKLQEELIKFEKEENEEFRNRIDHYAWEKKEEVRTRYNRHLHEKNNSKTEELKTITEEEKENVNPDDPNIEEEIDTTKKKNSAFQLAGKKEATGQKEDDTIKLEIDFNNYLMPYDTVINMAANSIIKLLQHPSYEMIKFALSKIYPLMKLVQGDIKQKAKIIFRILSVSLSVEIKHRDRRNQFSKEILNILGDIKKDDLLPISIESCPDFYNFLNHLSVNYQNYNLEIRKDSIKIMHYFLKEYVEFMDNNNSQRDTILQENKSLDQLFKDLYTLANESDEDIRFIATDSLRIIIEEFIPNRKIEKTQEYNEDLKKIRKNLSKAFDNTEMINKIDFYSSQETQKNEYECIQGIIKLAIDETHEANRDLLLDIIFTLNKKLPFTLIKDFRIANVKGMFRRVELLQNIVVTK